MLGPDEADEEAAGDEAIGSGTAPATTVGSTGDSAAATTGTTTGPAPATGSGDRHAALLRRPRSGRRERRRRGAAARGRPAVALVYRRRPSSPTSRLSTTSSCWSGAARAPGVFSIVAVHSTARGPALGGCRMWGYDDSRSAVRDALRLSRAMTLKSAVAGLPLGGGKGVIVLPEDAPPPAGADAQGHPARLRRHGRRAAGRLHHRRGRRHLRPRHAGHRRAARGTSPACRRSTAAPATRARGRRSAWRRRSTASCERAFGSRGAQGPDGRGRRPGPRRAAPRRPARAARARLLVADIDRVQARARPRSSARAGSRPPRR